MSTSGRAKRIVMRLASIAVAVFLLAGRPAAADPPAAPPPPQGAPAPASEPPLTDDERALFEIGRASCRERV